MAEKARKKLKSELRREAIIQNALKIFDRRGFANTSLDDIARETGVKREAIYYYFKNRAEILLNIVRPQSQILVEGLRQIITSQDTVSHKFYLAVRHHLESFAEAEQTYADAGRRESPPESEENIAEAQRCVSTVMRLLRRPLGRLADGDQV